MRNGEAGGRDIDQKIDALTEEVRSRMITFFLGFPEIRVIRRHPVAVLDRPYTLQELQACIGRPLSEAIMQVLWEFQFTLVERRLFLGDGERINRNGRLDTSVISKIAEKTGARSILAGSAHIDDEFIRVTYWMIRVETMEIIGMVSGDLSREEFMGCFLEYDLKPPDRGICTDIPETKRIS